MALRGLRAHRPGPGPRQAVGGPEAAGRTRPGFSRGPHGRRLDFLTQELNREANTLGAKSSMAETSQKAVDLKVAIEQIREQVQNIE